MPRPKAKPVLRIAHILNHTRQMNGHVHAAVDLACAQAAMGHDVAVISRDGDFDDLLAEHGVASIRLDQTRRLFAMARAVHGLHKVARDWQPDVIHAHMMTSAIVAWPICKTGGIPLITTVHNAFEKSAVLMGLGSRVIAVSEAVDRLMQQRGIAASRIRVVLNGTIGAARDEKKDRTPVLLSSPSVLFVGGLHPRKGLDDLFAAFDRVHADHPEAQLYIAGDGPFRAEYEAEVGTLDCASSVTFLGPVKNAFALMAGADVFVLPSLADPAPLVIPEAREAGCAIVATAVDGIPELLDGGEAGLLVPRRSPRQLAEAIASLICDPDMLADAKTKSRRNCERLNVMRVAEETVAVYRDAMKQPKTAAKPIGQPSAEGITAGSARTR